MDSLKIAEFLFARIEETVDYKDYIKEISIKYYYAESYGNEYIQISYTIEANDRYEALPFNEKQTPFHKTPNYTFSLSTNKTRDYNEKKRWLRIIEFKHIYESLSAYAILQFEKHLLPGTPIKVKSIDLWPEANYAEKYFSTEQDDQSRKITFGNFQREVSQWDRLHEQARQFRKIYAKEKDRFTITDLEINQLCRLELDHIRSILLGKNVPIRIVGIKTIDKIHIHTAKLVDALKKELTDEYAYKYYRPTYMALITYLYDHYLTTEKETLTRHLRSDHLKTFIIQKGDILQLHNTHIVMANAITIDQENRMNVEYTILKNDLQPGERTRVVRISDIHFFLKKEQFEEFSRQTPIKHLSLLNKWMSKRKVLLDLAPFKPDLTKAMDNEPPS